MGTYVELLSNLVQMFILTWFISKFLGYKYEKVKRKIGFLLVCIIAFLEISFINSIIMYDGLLSGIVVITYIVYSQLFLKGTIQAQIFVLLFAECIIFTLGSITIFLFSYILGGGVESVIEKFSIWRFIMILLCRTFEWIIFKIILKMNFKYSLTKMEWILFTTLPLTTWFAITIMTSAVIISKEILPYMLYITLLLLMIDVIIYYFMIKIKQDFNTKMEYQLLKMQYDNIQDMETNMKALYDSTYSLKHDLDKHFLAIKEMAYHNDCKEIGKYVENIIEKSSDLVQKIVFTDNDIFNAIINTKLEICRQRGIKTSISIDNAAVAQLKNEYIAVLFGNIFDNAIEAAANSQHKYIVFSVSQKREYISITLENTYDSNFSDVNLSTTKKNKTKHGFGTKNVRKIVAENNGIIQTLTKDKNIFCCDILLQK